MNLDLALDIAVRMGIRWECVVLHPYLDSVGVPTIGIGATYYEDGTRVQITDPPISLERAKELQVWMIKTKYLPAIIKICPNINDPERLAAIIDFTFNLGVKNLKISNLQRKINAEKWPDVPKELLKWNKAGGRVLKGLTARRKAEGIMCYPTA